MSKRWMPQSLDDVPDRLILFDGVRVLCCWWVRFVIEHDASTHSVSSRSKVLADRRLRPRAAPGVSWFRSKTDDRAFT
jgi:hypothetical protein